MEMGGICKYSRMTVKLKAFHITPSFPFDFFFYFYFLIFILLFPFDFSESSLKTILDFIEEAHPSLPMSIFFLKAAFLG